ncbi:MAG TPA: glycosyltransferase family 39 protein [Candidatus Omnitrophota bacterium]|nr:glycosyltransferase family 39 protein [Candidatus Omnitrophota bacterium]
MRSLKPLFLIIAFMAVALRLWGIGFALPDILHQDEPIIVNHALAYGSGDLNPHFFIIPPTCSYLLFVVYGLCFCVGIVFGFFSNAADFARVFFADPTVFYLMARLVLGFLPSLGSVFLTYRIYMRFFSDRRGAMYASLLSAVAFLNVVNAHYAYVDNMLVFMVLCACMMFNRVLERHDLKGYLLSAAFIGLAVNVKYNAVILLVGLFTAHILSRRNITDPFTKSTVNRYFLGSFIMLPVVIAITNPFMIFDGGLFIEQLMKIRSESPGWSHHLLYSLAEGISWPILAAAFAGIVVAYMKTDRRRFFLLIGFPVCFYIHLSLKSQLFSRYALPLIPFLAVYSAYFISNLYASVVKKGGVWLKFTATVCVLLVLAPTFVKSVKADLLFSKPDTRSIARKWMEENLPAKTAVVVDHTSFRPAIFQTKEQIESKKAIAGTENGLEGIKNRKIQMMSDAIGNKKTFTVYFLNQKGNEEMRFLAQSPTINPSLDEFKEHGVRYVTINYNNRDWGNDEFLPELKKQAVLIKEFSPYNDGGMRMPKDRIDYTYMPISGSELFSRCATGPCMAIYMLKDE